MSWPVGRFGHARCSNSCGEGKIPKLRGLRRSNRMLSQCQDLARRTRIATTVAACAALLWATGEAACLGYDPLVLPTYNLPQGGPMFRGNNPRFHNYEYQHPIPPVLQPDSYFYYRRPPYYTNFPPPYAYPYASPYLAPGVRPQVAP